MSYDHPILQIREKQIKDSAVKEAEKNLKEKYKPTTQHLLIAGMTLSMLCSLFNTTLVAISGFFCACYLAELFINRPKATQIPFSNKNASEGKWHEAFQGESGIVDVDDSLPPLKKKIDED